MKKHIKIAIISAIVLIVLFCASILYIKSRDNLKFKFEYELYNNVAYENGKYIKVNIDVNNKVKYVNADELLNILNNETAVVYFGYSTCPWCRNIISTLVDVTNKYDSIKKLYYFDVKQDFFSIKDELYNYLNDYLEEDSENNKRLYVPDVYFIKNGKIVYHHLSTVESYTDPFQGMNDEQEKELTNIYEEGIKLILEDDNNE